MKARASAGVAILACVLVAQALAAGDVQRGKKVFRRCQACHSVVSENGVGPYLNGVLGRTAGTVKGFSYSKAMLAAGAEGLVWNEQTLAEFLKKPKTFIKGTKMSFVGLRRDADIANITAYLKSVQ